MIGGATGREVFCLDGRVHLYEGRSAAEVVFGVRLLAALGCKAVLLTNAAGGIQRSARPGDLMLVVDHLNLTGQNPLVGPVEQARFPDMSEAYDVRLRELARKAAALEMLSLSEGVYAGLLGPNYETPAEVRMLERLGADAVGMSTVLEVIALRERGVRVGAVSTITNLAAGLSSARLDHDEVRAVGRLYGGTFTSFLRRWCDLVSEELGHE
jgi:purine-nucleoside phosphorylase